MIFRTLTESGLDRVLALLPAGQVGVWADADLFRKRLATGEYRPEWTWVAEETGEPHAVAVWWGNPGDERPGALDTLNAVASPARTDVAAELLAAAHTAFGQARPEFHLLLPADWRERPDVVADLGWRREAARRAGLTTAVERLRYEWTRDSGVPAPSRRLRFRPEADDEVFAGLFRRVLDGTLDAASRAQALAVGAEAQARADVAFYRDSMPGERSWWRVAEDAGGRTVGFALPSRNTGSHVVGYLGVLPEQRGHGYVDDLLAEITRVLAQEAGADVVRADTDLTNHPMAAAFDRLGYRNVARRLVLSAA
ncbi:GNAT family N-acetyltransferase [Streptomyces chromofuscus]|uniref:GNAT family N-acetyltransferase n=1 Tax=Streptomyces chromofuscus TaxID=42881 RepID=A0A7M2T6C4_STRCW|nr:GNAT family N-acetyltransferase [Streptomyces chromofuscus]QOV44227.1 GNAT family N-acetyltransferase [Streptomyces chromofuscus]GGT31636.1 N-acetyltransferase [Streptomyces chromofuscus]